MKRRKFKHKCGRCGWVSWTTRAVHLGGCRGAFCHKAHTMRLVEVRRHNGTVQPADVPL